MIYMMVCIYISCNEKLDEFIVFYEYYKLIRACTCVCVSLSLYIYIYSMSNLKNSIHWDDGISYTRQIVLWCCIETPSSGVHVSLTWIFNKGYLYCVVSLGEFEGIWYAFQFVASTQITIIDLLWMSPAVKYIYLVHLSVCF